MENFDDFIDKLQTQIFDEAKEAYGEKGFERWQNPIFQGKMEDPDGFASITGKCGDTMEIYLKFDSNRVITASYFTDGCASSSLSGSFAAEMAVGKDPDELTGITGESVLKAIGRLPEKDQHCADLAAETVQKALVNYMVNNQDKTTGN